jgi:hypothetical protein
LTKSASADNYYLCRNDFSNYFLSFSILSLLFS